MRTSTRYFKCAGVFVDDMLTYPWRRRHVGLLLEECSNAAFPYPSVSDAHAPHSVSPITEGYRPPNVLSLSRAWPSRACSATRKRRAKRGAEAPGQRTAARRLL